MRIFSSAEYWRRVALRISRTVCSELRLLGLRFVIIVPLGINDEPKVSFKQSGQYVQMALTWYRVLPQK